MTSQEMYRTRPQNATPTPRRWSLVAFAAGFLLLYLTADFVVANLASSTMPLPNVSAEVTQRWFADNPLAAVMIGVCQLLSVACLGGFAVSLRQGAATAGQVHVARKAMPCAASASRRDRKKSARAYQAAIAVWLAELPCGALRPFHRRASARPN